VVVRLFSGILAKVSDPDSKQPPDAAGSGSVDVQVSGSELPSASASASASASGSVEVELSSASLPAASEGIPEAASGFDSQPVASGAVPVATPTEGTGPVGAGRRITSAMQGAVSGGIEALGGGVSTIGEGVTKLGDVTRKLPLVGASIGKLGEGITTAGESIHALPRVAQTRRGRLLVRSVIVGFLLVFGWIAAIVGFQIRANDVPDFRPIAERLLVEISEGETEIAEVYDQASPRFHEVARRERFIDDMLDLSATNGKFRELTAINETLVTSGPTGRVGRIGLTALYEHGVARGSISFHWDRGRWRLLGIGIEVPRDVEITQAERAKRVAACLDAKGRDVSDQRAKCDVRDAAETILERIRDGEDGEVWDAASDVFQKQETRARFIEFQAEHRAALGNYKRILNVTEARVIAGTTGNSALFDVVAEFERTRGTRVVFRFTRTSRTDPWQLHSLKISLPMPRANEAAARAEPDSFVPLP
jgi:hypothetical protein